jgi:GT2 family glycosyltransferase
MMGKVAVVVLNYNGANFLRKFLPDLIRFSTPHEVYVADNASVDESIKLIQSEFSGVKLICFEKNLGFTGGYNEALKRINADYFIIINSDVAVTENWINPLLEFLALNKNYAAVQPKIKSIVQPEFFEYAGAAGGFIDSWGYPFCRGRIFNVIEKDIGQYDQEIDVDWTSGACMLIRSEVFHGCGGFDLEFFAHMEEIDLCWRIRKMGFKLACIPFSVVYHVGGGTLSKTSPLKTYLNFRNGLSMLAKNLATTQLWKIPIRLFLDLLASFLFMKNSGINHFLAVIKAQIHFLFNLPELYKKRNAVNKMTAGSTESPQNRPTKSILLNYFVLGKRHFKAL